MKTENDLLLIKSCIGLRRIQDYAFFMGSFPSSDPLPGQNVHPPDSATQLSLREGAARQLLTRLNGRHVVLIGLMGAGKTSVGKRLAQRLRLPFIDSDQAIEESARMTIPEIFALRGEAEFRTGERKVIARLLGERQHVIATGGGAYMDPQTREKIAAQGISLWLNADLPTLMRRVLRRPTRPLLQNPDPEGTMRVLMEARYPVYAQADVQILSEDAPHDAMVDLAVAALLAHLAQETHADKKTPGGIEA